MKLSPEVKDIRRRYVAAFPVPQTPGGGDAHEERCRQWAIAFAEQVAFERPGEGWGVKRADPGRPISKDTIARQIDGRLLIWDLLSGTGTGTPSLVDDPDSQDVTGQVFVPASPVNHLDGDASPAPVPVPPPPGPPTDVALILQEIKNLSVRFATLETDVERTNDALFAQYEDVLKMKKVCDDTIALVRATLVGVSALPTKKDRFEGSARFIGHFEGGFKQPAEN